MDICDFFWPRVCINCGLFGREICLECQDLLPKVNPVLCPLCKRPTSAWQLCKNCQRSFSPIKQFFTLGDFQNPLLKKAIFAFKFSHQRGVIETLAEYLASKLKEGRAEFDFIIPVPITKKDFFERGYNQSAVLARTLSRFTEKEVLEKVLLKVRETLPQRTLSRRERLRNVAGAFSLKDPQKFIAKRILVVDDVVTTGATLKEIASLFKKTGAKRIIATAVAREF